MKTGVWTTPWARVRVPRRAAPSVVRSSNCMGGEESGVRRKGGGPPGWRIVDDSRVSPAAALPRCDQFLQLRVLDPDVVDQPVAQVDQRVERGGQRVLVQLVVEFLEPRLEVVVLVLLAVEAAVAVVGH